MPHAQSISRVMGEMEDGNGHRKPWVGAAPRSLFASGFHSRRHAGRRSGGRYTGPAGGVWWAGETCRVLRPPWRVSRNQGGTLRVGVSGGGSDDILDAHTWSTQIDGARVCQLYDWLATRDPEFKLVPMLGTEFTPNATGDETIVKLRPGVTFHNGKPLTAADVVFTFHRILDPKVGASGHALISSVLEGSRRSIH